MKFFFRAFFVFIFLLLTFQIITDSFLKPFPRFDLLNTYLEEKKQIIYLGDSVIFSGANNDTDHSSISEMTEKMNNGITIGDYSSPAYNPILYEGIMDYLSRQSYKPEAVILPVNLRSFSPLWKDNPMFQFEKEKFYFTSQIPLLYHFYKPLAVMRAINANTISWDSYYGIPVYYGEKQVGTMKDFDNEKKFASSTEAKIREKYIVSYLFNLKQDDRSLLALERTLDIATHSGIKVYLYITPLDHEKGEDYFGKDFTTQIQKNAKIVCDMVKEKGFQCLDLSSRLPHKNFSTPDYPVEHLDQSGRTYVAEQVTKTFLKRR